jgi:plastocyanin
MKRLAPIAAMLVMLVALASAALLGRSDSAQAQQQTTIAVGSFWFCDASHSGNVCETTITQGDTVVWDFSSAMATHTTTGTLWDSGNMNTGTFAFTFNDAGSYDYHCNVHPTLMMGRIVVQAAAPEATATAPLSGGHTPAPTKTSGGVPTVVLPITGQGPSGDAADPWWLFAAVAAAGVALSGLGALAYTRRRS